MNHYFTHFDKLFQELQYGFDEPQPQQVKDTCRLPKYPVSNCYLAEDQNSLHFEFALAGYKEKEVQVIGGKNSFTVRARKEESLKSHMLLHHGISGKDVDFSIKVDEQYNTKKAKVSYVNGLLSVIIPKEKEAESVMLFG
jgi:HSP20 family molecular chaperone IbpA